MIRNTLLTLALICATTPAIARGDISAAIGADGLARTEADLAAMPAPDANDLFALGGVRFLRAVERALQARFQYGMSGRTMDVPVLRLEVAENPAAEPFYPELIQEIFAGVISDMALAKEPLAAISADANVAVRIDLGDLWFDINMNDARDNGEGLAELAAGTIIPRRFGNSDKTTPPVIQFDTSDVAWLQAYTHFLSGLSEMVLAYPPASAIERVLKSAGEMRTLVGDAPPTNAFDHLFSTEADLAMMVYLALQQPPQAEHTRAARRHFLEMIRLNRNFWAALDTETDNDAEWIPNARQTSALGVRMPAETGEAWLAILQDAEDLLEGRKLVPHWRYGSQAGVNLKRLLENPVPVNLAEWAQGMGLLPYAEKGQRIGTFNWRNFTRMMRGESMLYVILLN